MRDFKHVPYVKLKDYYKKLDAKAKAEAEEHRRKRNAAKNSSDDDSVDADSE